LNKPINIALAALALLVCASAASAQPANVNVVSGNGQLICQCQYGGPVKYFFDPITVRVTDALGVPVSGAAVDWAITSGGFNGTLGTNQTVTDVNGYSTNIFNAGPAPAGISLITHQQTTLSATAGAASATVYLTQAIQSQPPPGVFAITPFSAGVPPGGRELITDVFAPFTGALGSTLDPPITLFVVGEPSRIPIPNVAVFIENDQPADQGPTLTCRTGTGASTNTVFTDARGVATCDPVFGGTTNITGTAKMIIGGTIPTDGSPGSYVFPATRIFHIRSTPGAVGSIRIVSGNNQSATSGQTLANPLVVEVLGPSGTPVGGQVLNWTVAPVGGAALNNTQTTTDASGRSSNPVRFPALVTGTVTVTATVASDTTKSVTFTLTAVPVVQVIVTGLTAVSGSGQTAMINTAFAAPLVVQVSATGGTLAGAAIAFSVNGPAAISNSTVNTGADGRAQVTVQAGGTAGPVTVTASTAGFTATFNLTVAPLGPTLLPSSFVNTADQGRGMLSPCSLATIIATGLAPGIQNMINAPMVGLLPGVLANTSVTVGGTVAPISGVGRNPAGQEIVTFQVPCNVNPSASVPVTVNVGGATASINIPIQAASPGVFLTTGSDGLNRAVVVRPDGSFVHSGNPARKGENLVALVTGLGSSIPTVSSNSVAAPNSVTAPQGTVVVGMAGRGVPLVSAQLSPDMVGVWLVTFTVPSDAPTGNATFSVSVIPPAASAPISSGSAIIPVQ
jgi:uncharacterized protein (TIGR03437 family)